MHKNQCMFVQSVNRLYTNIGVYYNHNKGSKTGTQQGEVRTGSAKPRVS